MAVNDQLDSDRDDQDSPEESAPQEGMDDEETSSEADSVAETKRQVTLAVPPIDRLLVLVGAAAMVLAGLLSWVNVAPDAFPNFAGIGAGGGGVGLVVFLAGLALLSGKPRIDTANGVALGAFLASLITVLVLFDELEGTGMGAGAWVAMIGSFLALTGIALATMDPARRPGRQVTHNAIAALGAALAVIASFWMDWVIFGGWGFSAVDTGPLGADFVVGGLHSDVATGYPVLILSVLVLLLLLGLLSPTASVGMQSKMAMHIRTAGIAVVVLGAGDLVGSVMSPGVVGSGPILALVGGLMIARSVGSAEAATTETAGAEAA